MLRSGKLPMRLKCTRPSPLRSQQKVLDPDGSTRKYEPGGLVVVMCGALLGGQLGDSVFREVQPVHSR